MKAIIVKPHEKPVICDIENNLESYQHIVDGYIECAYPFLDEVALICNEEGKINGMELNRALLDEDGNIFDIVAGTFVIVGLTDNDFADVPENLVDAYCKRFEHPEAFLMINGKLTVVREN